jgi:hypothetical protein
VFVEYRFCLNHKFGFSYIDDFLVKAFQTGWCIFCVTPFFLSYQIYPVLTNNGGYPRSRFLAVFLFSVWSLVRDAEALAIEKDLILSCSQVLLLDHHVGGGPSWAGLHHAGGPTTTQRIRRRLKSAIVDIHRCLSRQGRFDMIRKKASHRIYTNQFEMP